MFIVCTANEHKKKKQEIEKEMRARNNCFTLQYYKK